MGCPLGERGGGIGLMTISHSSPDPSTGARVIQAIARREFIDLTRDGRFRWSGLVIAGLLLVALGAGYTAHRAARADRDGAQSQMQAWWYQQPPKNPHSAAHYGLWAFKPMPPLAFVERGVDPYVGTASWLEAHRQNDFGFRPAMDATAVQRFGEWSAATVLQQLVPLLIVVLAFGAFASEREHGTLRQVASLGVPARALVIGKSIGISAALAIILIPAALVGALALGLSAGFTSGDGVRLALLAVVYLVWFALVLAVVLAVSLWASSGKRALVTLLGVWAFSCAVAPRLVAAGARALHPTPSRAAFQSSVEHDLANGLDGHSPAGERAKQFEQQLLTAHGVRTRAELPENFDALVMQASEVHGDSVYDHHFGALNAQFTKQTAIQQAAAVVAPLVAVRFLSTAIAGTDLTAHRAFADAAESYRRGIQVRMNGWLARNTKPGETFSARADSAVWAEVPPFVFTAPSVRAALASYAVSGVVLFGWVLLAFAVIRTRSHLAVE